MGQKQEVADEACVSNPKVKTQNGKKLQLISSFIRNLSFQRQKYSRLTVIHTSLLIPRTVHQCIVPENAQVILKEVVTYSGFGRAKIDAKYKNQNLNPAPHNEGPRKRCVQIQT